MAKSAEASAPGNRAGRAGAEGAAALGFQGGRPPPLKGTRLREGQICKQFFLPLPEGIAGAHSAIARPAECAAWRPLLLWPRLAPPLSGLRRLALFSPEFPRGLFFGVLGPLVRAAATLWTPGEIRRRIGRFAARECPRKNGPRIWFSRPDYRPLIHRRIFNDPGSRCRAGEGRRVALFGIEQWRLVRWRIRFGSWGW